MPDRQAKSIAYNSRTAQKRQQRKAFDTEIENLKDSYQNMCPITSISKFTDFPLSESTNYGLKQAYFSQPTDIQKQAIHAALRGKDVVASAETGSGKTLAFVVPLIECMYVNKICELDGVSALILTPTRELARQIFRVLSKVAIQHRFSILDVMGGRQKSVNQIEWDAISRANVIIATPGRIAQHLLENSSLALDNLKMLILDEADRLLDPTFKNDLNSILDNLSDDKQILLFSATQHKSLNQLSRLNLKNAEFVSTFAQSSSSEISLPCVPATLSQYFVEVTCGQKLDVLWNFLQSHCRKKILVFFSTQKQVRFVTDLFKLLRPYFSCHQLRGNMRQDKRFRIFEQFTNVRQGSVLFSTNLSERGLDFPEVDWVVQVDCAKTVEDYVHRVGRTARGGRSGRSLLFLLPSELEAISILADHNIILRSFNLSKTKIEPRVSNRAPQMVASNPEISASARCAFTAYLRDYSFRPKTASKKGADSGIFKFKVSELDPDALAASLGLPNTPQLPETFAGKQHQKMSGAEARAIFAVDEVGHEGLLEKKKVLDIIQTEEVTEPTVESATHVKFSEPGGEGEKLTAEINEGPLDLEAERQKLREQDKTDKEAWRQRIRDRHRKDRLKKKQARREENALRAGVKENDGSGEEEDAGDDSAQSDQGSETEGDFDSEEDYDAGSDVVSDYEGEETESGPEASEDDEVPSVKRMRNVL